MEREEGRGNDDREAGGPATDALDPEGFERRVAQFLEWMRVHGYSAQTVKYRAWELGHFVTWCADRGIARPSDVTKPVLERYQATLFHARQARDEERPLALPTQREYLTALRGLFRWLVRQNLILANPAADLVLPRTPKRLPKHVLSVEEVERVLAATDIETAIGLRDRAILETLYSTGIRRKELVALALYDLDYDRGTARVREGKGGHQRVVPIGERAVAWVEKYVHEVRPSFLVPPDEGVLFLTHRGKPIEADSLSVIVRGYVERAGIEKEGSVHLFRHTCATLMLERGADVRYVQELLGHARLDTTTIYTRVSIQKLKEVHTATHPALLKATSSSAAGPRAASGAPAAPPAGDPPPLAGPPPPPATGPAAKGESSGGGGTAAGTNGAASEPLADASASANEETPVRSVEPPSESPAAPPPLSL